MRKLITFLLLSIIIMLLFGCTLIQRETPAPTPTIDILSEQNWHIEGVIFNVRSYDHIVVDFGEIKDQPSEIAFFGTVTFTEDCVVWKLEGDAVQPASLSDLAIGQRIKISAKEILESYSVIAKEILIVSPGAVEIQTPISTFLTPQFTGVITSIDDYVKIYLTKLIHMDVISSPKYPNVEETVFALAIHSLLWQKTETGYQLITEDNLAVGQIVSILLVYAYDDEITESSPYHGLVEEVIVLP